MNRNSRSLGYILAIAVFFGLLGCGDGRDAPASMTDGEGEIMATIEGNVVYRERMALPPGIEVEVILQDISKADALATDLASVVLTPTSGPPYPFTIDYDPSTINERLRYAVRATISMQGKMLFSSTDYIDPFAGNPVEILVRRVPEPVERAGPELEETIWQLQSLGDEPAPTGAGGKSLDIQFLAEDMRVGGFSGCNRYSGGYAREGVSEYGAALQIGPLASTMMACMDGGELEQDYLQRLGKVSGFRFEGADLVLLSGPEAVATYRARQ